MRILFKLIAGFLIVAALTGVIAYIGLTNTNAIESSYRDVQDETFPVMDSLEQMKFYTEELIHQYTHSALFKSKDQGFQEELNNASEEYYSSLNKYEALVIKYFPEEIESLEKIKSATERFNRSGHDILELGKSDAPLDGSIELDEMTAAEEELIDAIDEALENENKKFDERSEKIGLTIKSTRDSVLLIGLITFFLSIVIGAVIAISISNPIVKLTDAAREISRGGQGTSVDIRSNDETGILAGAFNKMVRDLSNEIEEHKQTAANLNERNEFVKIVLESLPHPFYVIDAKDYTVTLANSAACVQGSAAGTTCYALTHKTDKPCGTQGHMCPLEEVKRTGKPAVAEHLHYDKDGNVRNMEVHCYPIFDSFGNVVQAIEYSLDITERKRAQEALADSEESYRNIIENSNDLVWSLDKNGNFTFLNKQSDIVTGYRTSDFIGKSFVPLLNKDDIPRIMDIFQKTLSGKLQQYEVTIKRSDGSDLTLSVNSTPYYSKGVISGAVSFARDITQSKLAEIALMESEERFRSVAQSANDAIISSDGDGYIIFWNKAAQKIFGYDGSEVMGKPLTMLIPEIYREAHQKGLERMHTTGVPNVIGKTLELLALRKNGREFPMEIALSTWKTGEKIFFSAIMRDITERRRNEGIQRENERLALANRAKSNFLMVMSHELRTPLNAIIGFTELLKKKEAGDLNQKQQRYADNVHLSGKNLLRIIDDLLDLTRVESGKMEFTIEHVSVPVAVNEVLENIKEKAGKQNIIIKKDLGPEIESIDTDEQKFKQVLNNLIDNAVKFSKPEGGTVTITAEKEGDIAKFSVADSGIGIKEENMGRLFHSFEQLDSGIARKYGGTGLGLAVSKKLVELLGGRITAHSKYGEGSTFTFYLPVAAKKEGGG